MLNWVSFALWGFGLCVLSPPHFAIIDLFLRYRCNLAIGFCV